MTDTNLYAMTESDMTSPSSTTSSSTDLRRSTSKKMEDKLSYRKSNKPMMEKKRRARINSCLSQLKSLVLQAMKKDNSQYSKLEKADILEMTVKHLKNVQRLQNNCKLNSPPVPDAINKYRAGFNECANEVMRYLADTPDVNSDSRNRILSHLTSILTPINSLPLQQSHTPILPAPSVSSASASLSSSSSHLQHRQLQQSQQQIVQHPIHATQTQQLHQHQKQTAMLLNQLGDNLSSRPETTQPDIKPVCQLTGSENDARSELNRVIATSPAAFQTPMVKSLTVPGSSAASGLQLPCLATTTTTTHAGMAPLQLFPSTLPSGQVAFVLAPQAIPAMSLYTPPTLTPSTLTSDFSISMLGQQQSQQSQQKHHQHQLHMLHPHNHHQQEQHQQQQQLQHQNIKQPSQPSIPSANRLTSSESPVVLVTQPSISSRKETDSFSPQPHEKTHTSSTSTSSSKSLPSASPTQSPAKSGASSRDHLSQSVERETARTNYRDINTAKIKSDESATAVSIISSSSHNSKQDDIENLGRGVQRELPKTFAGGKRKKSATDFPRRGISDHYSHQNIVNVYSRCQGQGQDYRQGQGHRDVYSGNGSKNVFLKTGDYADASANGWGSNLGISHHSELTQLGGQVREEHVEMQAKKRSRVDITNNSYSCEVIDYSRTNVRTGSEVKEQSKVHTSGSSTWRPW